MRILVEGKNKLDFFKELKASAEMAQGELIKNLDKWYEQYKGSPKIDGGAKDATAVRNISYELVESQVSGYIPMASVRPKVWSEKSERNAKNIETLLNNLRDIKPYEKMNDIDERYAPIYGGSIRLTEWDNSIITHDTVGEIETSMWSPKRFIGQPNIHIVDDMEYYFIVFDTTKEDIVRKYGVSEAVAQTAAEETLGSDNVKSETAEVTICFYKNEDDKCCLYVWAGETELSDIDNYNGRKRYICKKCGKRKEICECEKPKYEMLNEEYEELDHDVVLSDGTVIPAMSEVIKDGEVVMETVSREVVDEEGLTVMEEANGVLVPMMTEVQVPKLQKTRIPFYSPTKAPVVIRKNTSQEDSVLGQSDMEFIRPQQQAINKLESRIMQKIMGGGVYACVPEDIKMEDSLDNSIWGKVFRFKSSAQKAMLSTIDLQANIAQDIMQSDRNYDHAKRILGITDSYQGQYDSSAQSGKAKQIQVQQATGRLDSKRRMKNAAYAESDEAIFQLYLAYADEPRKISYKDSFGRTHNAEFNKYDFLERDKNGEYYYNDQYMFSTDQTGDVEKDRQTIWQMNKENFAQGMFGDITQLETQLIYWQNQERMHYPTARENVERLTESIKQRDEGLQAQLMQANGKIEKMNNPSNILAYAERMKSRQGVDNGNI